MPTTVMERSSGPLSAPGCGRVPAEVRFWPVAASAVFLSCLGTDQGEGPLGLGSTVAGRLAAGEIHHYVFDAEAQEFASLEVQQRGLDVVVTLVTPGGGSRTVVDIMHGSTGNEAVTLVTDAAGRYRVEIAPFLEGASGEYAVSLNDLRPAQGQDRVAVEAAGRIAEAMALGRQATPEAGGRAIDKLEQAARLWAEAGVPLEEADTLNTIGAYYRRLNQPEVALDYHRRALARFQEIDYRKGQGVALHNMGHAYRLQGELEAAKKRYEEALKLREAEKDRSGIAATLHNLSRVSFSLGQVEEARRQLVKALRLRQVLGDSSGQAATLHELGVLHNRQGKTEEGVAYLDRALNLARRQENQRLEAAAVNNLALAYSVRGELQTALDSFHKTLELNRQMGNWPAQATILQNLGQLYHRLGDAEKSFQCYQDALHIRQRRLGGRGEANLLNWMGWLKKVEGEAKEAIDLLEQALEQSQELKDRPEEAWALASLGEVHVSLDDVQKGRRYLHRALEIWDELEYPQPQTNVLRSLGRLSMRDRRLQDAESYFNQALALERQLGNPAAESLTLLRLATLERRRGRLFQAHEKALEAIAIVESLRSNVESQDLRTSFFADKRGYYDFTIDLLMELAAQHPKDGYEAAALELNERSLARTLVDILAESRAQIRQGIPAHLRERYLALKGQINSRAWYHRRLLGSQSNPEAIQALEEDLEELLSRYRNLEAEIRRRSPRFATLTQPRPVDLEAIQQQVLDAETVLLEFSLGEDRSFLWLVTRESLKSFQLPARTEIESLARQVYQLLIAPSEPVEGEKWSDRQERLQRLQLDYVRKATELSRMLLGQAFAEITDERLLVVSQGALRYIPFAALPHPQGSSPGEAGSGEGQAEEQADSDWTPLIARHEVIGLPSASVLTLLRRQAAHRPPAAKTVAVFADPVFTTADPRVSRQSSVAAMASPPAITRSGRHFRRLRFTEDEAKAIRRWVDQELIFLAEGFAASRHTFATMDLTPYRYVHIATHAVPNHDQPELSEVVFSLVDKKGRPQDGFLRLHEIFNLRLRARLVVLSACQTALGREVRGEGLIGLTRGFMYAGAEQVLASLWNVEDEATAELMGLFYEGMLKDELSAAEALRQAQLDMWKQERKPLDWAGFVLQGEWR